LCARVNIDFLKRFKFVAEDHQGIRTLGFSASHGDKIRRNEVLVKGDMSKVIVGSRSGECGGRTHEFWIVNRRVREI